MKPCRRCSSGVEQDDLWCRACGVWVSEVRGFCEGPELHEASGACVVCGAPVCPSCSAESGGKTFCSDAGHQRLPDTHVLLDTYASEFEADWIDKNLKNEQIHSIVYAYRSHPGYYGLSLSRQAAIFVAKRDEEKARTMMDVYTEQKGR